MNVVTVLRRSFRRSKRKPKESGNPEKPNSEENGAADTEEEEVGVVKRERLKDEVLKERNGNASQSTSVNNLATLDQSVSVGNLIELDQNGTGHLEQSASVDNIMEQVKPACENLCTSVDVLVDLGDNNEIPDNPIHGDKSHDKEEPSMTALNCDQNITTAKDKNNLQENEAQEIESPGEKVFCNPEQTDHSINTDQILHPCSKDHADNSHDENISVLTDNVKSKAESDVEPLINLKEEASEEMNTELKQHSGPTEATDMDAKIKVNATVGKEQTFVLETSADTENVNADNDKIAVKMKELSNEENKQINNSKSQKDIVKKKKTKSPKSVISQQQLLQTRAKLKSVDVKMIATPARPVKAKIVMKEKPSTSSSSKKKSGNPSVEEKLVKSDPNIAKKKAKGESVKNNPVSKKEDKKQGQHSKGLKAKSNTTKSKVSKCDEGSAKASRRTEKAEKKEQKIVDKIKGMKVICLTTCQLL